MAQDRILVMVWIINQHQVVNANCLIDNKVFLWKWEVGNGVRSRKMHNTQRIWQNERLLAQCLWKIELNHLRVAGDTEKPDCKMS